MKISVYYFLVMNVAMLCLSISAAGLQEIQTELTSSKRAFQEMRNSLKSLSKDAKQDLATFCGDFCDQIDAMEKRHDQLIADVQDCIASCGKAKSKSKDLEASAADLRADRRALIKAYNNLLAQKIPNLNAR